VIYVYLLLSFVVAWCAGALWVLGNYVGVAVCLLFLFCDFGWIVAAEKGKRRV
jgi:hypothetical protein